MSQLAASDGQPGNWEEPGFFLRRLETVRFQAEGWQEPCESGGSRTVVRGTGGETPPVYPTLKFRHFTYIPIYQYLGIFGFLVYYHHSFSIPIDFCFKLIFNQTKI